MENKKVHISIVIPLLNEEGNISLLYKTLLPVLEKISMNYEIIFVDDGSKDNSFNIISEISNQNDHVLGISLSRNFGHQIALAAGIEHVSGEVVVTMDADMQHPPEVINELYQKYREGYDVINTLRTDTKDSIPFKKITSNWFYKIINKLSDIHIQPGAADFRLMSRKAVDAFLQLKEKNRFTRGLISWMGFKQTTVAYEAPSRFSGKSKYSILKMFQFSIDAITSFSAKPLRMSFYSGLIVSLTGLFYAIYAIFQYFAGKTIPGWTSILVSVLIIGGIQLISIGIIGEYLARIFNEAKNRPLYLVKQYTSNDSGFKKIK
ncbi:MAG: glycosyltransferase family 2 protein [Bacteroidetes bacterium]|nr:glycosyltransferase family 2 protein [Bacteroidota bacterium]